MYDNVCDTTCNYGCGYTRMPEHVYDFNCDRDCNVCGDVREADHAWDNACDTTCNYGCGYTRMPEHVYDFNCDRDCNVCGDVREADHAWDNDCDTACNYGCGFEREIEHVYKDNFCTICGYVKPSEGLEFTLNSDNVSYTVSGIGICTDTELIIPSEYNGLPVTTIGEYAFNNCSSLTSVVIPDSVTSIGYDTFYGCNSALYTEYEYGKYIGNAENPYAVLIGLTNKNLSSYTIHENTRIIADYVFYGCERLAGITIPDSVTTIGDDAFVYCDALTSVTIGDSVTTIGDRAFSSCSNLRTINFCGTRAEWAAISKGSDWLYVDWQSSNPTIVYNYSES